MAEPAMDEMTAVRQLRADAPVPDHARLTPARQRLLDEIGAPRRGYGGWQLRALAVVAAVVAAALLSTLTLRGDHTTPAKPAAPIGAHQWVYLESRYDTWSCRTNLGPQGYGEAGAFYMNPGAEPCTREPARSTDDEAWTRYDGGKQAVGDASGTGAVHKWGGPNSNYLSPQATDALVADLPEDPDAALRLILERSVPDRATYKVRLTQAQRDFDEVVEVLSGATDVPSDKARTIHRVITGLAGATEPVDTTDGAGRKVLAIGVDGNFRDYAWERNSMQVLLDPETFAYRGVRWVAGMDYYAGGKASGGPFVPKGTVVATSTRLATVVVDKAGERD
ncbi:hypothetical protein [Streptomyces sp. NPDC058295]|uniref:hypothetical protein n=1 Tax=Streptomyces sp. NPDC058295 TaxID=3346431 RepID=UPI0036E821BA